ncbi:helicase-associated domain-containing protein [Mariniluteicoccus flavus]
MADLATRAATEASARRALDRLDRRHLAVAEGLAALGDPSSVPEVAELVGLPPAEAAECVAALRDAALVWGVDDQLHVLRAVRSAFGPWPGGLAHPGHAALSPEAVDRALAGVAPAGRSVLERLQWGPPTGTVRGADRPLPPADQRSPVEHLLAAGLLRASGPETVVLPREVALRARGGFLREPLRTPPPLPEATHGARLVDHAGAGAAYELVHDVEAVVDDLGGTQPALLRSGGLGTRDLAQLARRHGLDGDRAAFLVELAVAAALASTSGGRVTATTAYDAWLSAAPVDRWLTLARAWRDARRWPAAALEGRALGEAGDVRWATEARAVALAALEPGRRAEAETWAETIAYARPGLVRHIAPDAVVSAVGRELGALGVVALSTVTRLLAPLRDAPLPDDVAALFPGAVDRFVVQADLTAVAGGPLEHGVGRVLRLLADQESRGGAGVFRFTAASVRRAFDAGWDAETIERWLADHSTTGVPQPLAYLIGDVGRVHGAIRVGRASAYVRVEDHAQVPSILGHPDAATLGLRQVGPGALVADADPDEVVALLRALGLAPAAEDASGGVLHAPSPTRTPARASSEPAPPDPGQVAARLAERARHASRRRGDTAATLTRLQAALETGRAVDIAFVDGTGLRDRRRLVPVHLGAGMARLVGAGEALTLPLARIIEVEDADSTSGA